ncbi:xanthine dehydrogenase accessory factor [Asanoa hainanensis]|uniref:Xanthine dehydrogenase accessory factor n=1 Tax=Asanoa hainanensis TaxID=560556 RepID=A0A239L6F2_9ACTN|nr:XdhC family protein [Asanoa hainanensis]SNT26186.1 xanthine dehydrogenase accessory factor [Asanoa hainanensis]
MTSTTEQRANELRQARSPFVLAVVVRAERPTSAKPGDRAIIHADGTIEGFVGGSCAESTVRIQSLRQLAAGESTLLRITPGGDSTGPRDLPGLVVTDNTCLSGGTIDVFLEVVVPAPLLQVYGDTPIARALVSVGSAAGYEVRIAPAPGPVPADALAVVVASHGHDETGLLAEAVSAGVPYIALVASPKRGAAVLAESGVPAGRVKTPAGLDLGARTPGDVAISILAEVVAARTGLPRPAPAPRAPLLQIGLAVPTPPEIAIDPICEMEVVVEPGALSYEHAGRTWYFCAPGCRKKFAADPARWGG